MTAETVQRMVVVGFLVFLALAAYLVQTDELTLKFISYMLMIFFSLCAICVFFGNQ